VWSPSRVLFIFGEVGWAGVNLDQKLNFIGPVTTVSQNVSGLNVGVGVAFQPANWQIAGNPLSLVVQYNRVILPVATSNNPGSPGFTYDNRNIMDKLAAGIRVQFLP
jgi:hypothetical protein